MISPYLRKLRERIGHDLVLLPSVAILVWDDQHRLLLVQSTDTGRWQTIGGAMEPDETPEQSALRETQEEAGVKVELTGLRTVVGGPDCRITYPNGDQVCYVSIIFDAKIVGGEIRPDNDETSAVQWFSEKELATLDMVDEFTRNLLKEALEDMERRSGKRTQ